MTTHNPRAIYTSYKEVMELLHGFVDANGKPQSGILQPRVRDMLMAVLQQHKYKSDKTEGHISGIPPRMFIEAIKGTPIEIIMERTFGKDDPALKNLDINEKKQVSLNRSLDREEVVEREVKRKVTSKKALKKVEKKKVIEKKTFKMPTVEGQIYKDKDGTFFAIEDGDELVCYSFCHHPDKNCKKGKIGKYTERVRAREGKKDVAKAQIFCTLDEGCIYDEE